MKKEKKKINTTKLKTKKYTIANIFGVLKRQILYFVSIVLLGVNIGCVLFLFVKDNTYSTSCTFSCQKKLDDFQKSRIVDYFSCNESVDTYLTSLKNAGVNHNGQAFTFGEISSGLFASVKSDTGGVVTFTASFSYKEAGYSYRVLNVVAQKCCSLLAEIYQTNFSVSSSSFAGEFQTVNRNVSYLLTPIAIMAIVSFAVIFIIDGLDDHIYDLSDGLLISKDVFLIDKKRRNNNAEEIKESIFLVSSNDLEKAKKILLDYYGEDINVIVCNSKKDFKEEGIKMCLIDNDFNVGDGEMYSYLVILGHSSYSEFVKNKDKLNTTKVNVNKVVFLRERVQKKK